jgi:alpha-ketoglutarate-dependent taurine dioxygenase
MLFWDNRSVLHLPIECPPEQRQRPNRTTIEGDVPRSWPYKDLHDELYGV